MRLFLGSFRPRPIMLVSIGAVVVLLAGGGFAAFESQQVSSYGEGVWWALSLMSTVGFVGEAPESTAGRLVSSILMISGFALMALVTASIASLFVREEELPDEAAEREFEVRALAVMSRHVGQSSDWWPAADGGVGSVVIVEVEPAREGFSPLGF